MARPHRIAAYTAPDLPQGSLRWRLSSARARKWSPRSPFAWSTSSCRPDSRRCRCRFRRPCWACAALCPPLHQSQKSEPGRQKAPAPGCHPLVRYRHPLWSAPSAHALWRSRPLPSTRQRTGQHRTRPAQVNGRHAVAACAGGFRAHSAAHQTPRPALLPRQGRKTGSDPAAPPPSGLSAAGVGVSPAQG